MINSLLLLFFSEFYVQVIELIDQFRESKLFKIRIGIWAIVALFTPEDSEKLHRSTELIDKSADYDVIHEWLGLGLLTRYVGHLRHFSNPFTPWTSWFCCDID